MKHAIQTLENIKNGAYDHKNGHRVGSKMWLEEENTICAAFKLDVLTELGLDTHPMVESIFDYVWNYWEESGRKEMTAHLEQIAAFVVPQPAPKRNIWSDITENRGRYLEDLDKLKEDQR